jgi:hypothetical protein
MFSRRFLLLALLLLNVSSPCPAEKKGALASTHLPYRRLTWSDFRIDDVSPGFSAQTETFLTYQYTARTAGWPGQYEATLVAITFVGGVDRAKSWRRSSVSPADTQLLAHEQGHLDINELKVRQLRTLSLIDLPTGRGKTVNEALEDLNKHLSVFQREQTRDMDNVQRQYDAETRHGTDREMQAQWSARLRHALQVMR